MRAFGLCRSAYLHGGMCVCRWRASRYLDQWTLEICNSVHILLLLQECRTYFVLLVSRLFVRKNVFLEFMTNNLAGLALIQASALSKPEMEEYWSWSFSLIFSLFNPMVAGCPSKTQTWYHSLTLKPPKVSHFLKSEVRNCCLTLKAPSHSSRAKEPLFIYPFIKSFLSH